MDYQLVQGNKFLIVSKADYLQYKNLDKIPTHQPATEPELATEPTKTKATKAKTNSKISSLRLREEFLNKIKNEEKI